MGKQTLREVQEAFSVPYPEEYRRVGVNPDLLSRIAYTTGGEYLDTLEGLSEQADHSLPPLRLHLPLLLDRKNWNHPSKLAYSRTCPFPTTTNLGTVSSRSPIGP